MFITPLIVSCLAVLSCSDIRVYSLAMRRSPALSFVFLQIFLAQLLFHTRRHLD